MRKRTVDEKQVNVNPGYCVADVGYNVITFEIHDEWKENRKKDPVYVLEMDLEKTQYLLMRLARAWVELKEKKAVRLQEQHHFVRRSVESPE